jgi:hypothetical protein
MEQLRYLGIFGWCAVANLKRALGGADALCVEGHEASDRLSVSQNDDVFRIAVLDCFKQRRENLCSYRDVKVRHGVLLKTGRRVAAPGVAVPQVYQCAGEGLRRKGAAG